MKAPWADDRQSHVVCLTNRALTVTGPLRDFGCSRKFVILVQVSCDRHFRSNYAPLLLYWDFFCVKSQLKRHLFFLFVVVYKVGRFIGFRRQDSSPVRYICRRSAKNRRNAIALRWICEGGNTYKIKYHKMWRCSCGIGDSGEERR